MSNSSLPSPEGLVFGAILVMLHGYRREIVTGLRTRASCMHDESFDYGDHPAYLDVKNCEEGYRLNRVLRTASGEILDLLAHTQQTLRISHDEWERLVKVERLPHYEGRVKAI